MKDTYEDYFDLLVFLKSKIKRFVQKDGLNYRQVAWLLEDHFEHKIPEKYIKRFVEEQKALFNYQSKIEE